MSYENEIARGFVVSSTQTFFGKGALVITRPATGRHTCTLPAAFAGLDLRNTLILVSPMVYDVFSFRVAQPRLFAPYTGAVDVLTFDNTHTLVNNDFSILIQRS